MTAEISYRDHGVLLTQMASGCPSKDESEEIRWVSSTMVFYAPSEDFNWMKVTLINREPSFPGA